MAIHHVELIESRNGVDATDEQSSGELRWTVWGSNDWDEIRDYLLQEDVVPLFNDGLVYKSLDRDPVGYNAWEVSASYVHPDKADKEKTNDLGSYTFSFDTMGGTVNRKVSLATTGYPKVGETATDYKGSINVDAEEGVQGVDIGVQALKLTIRKRMPRTTITIPYVKLLSDMSYTWNSTAWLGFEAGELLFIGATGQEATDSDPEIEYNFIASPNVTALTVGDITDIVKRGHDYLWVVFEKVEDTDAKTTPPNPKAAYVEQVYYSKEHRLLGI